LGGGAVGKGQGRGEGFGGRKKKRKISSMLEGRVGQGIRITLIKGGTIEVEFEKKRAKRRRC